MSLTNKTVTYYGLTTHVGPIEVRKVSSHGGYEPPQGMVAAEYLSHGHWCPIYVPESVFKES